MAGLVAKSTTDHFVSDLTMKNVVAEIAIYRALKAELPAITGITAEETFKMVGVNHRRSSDDEISITWSQVSAVSKEFQRRHLDESILKDATDQWDEYVMSSFVRR
jgi:hypothetical protein